MFRSALRCVVPAIVIIGVGCGDVSAPSPQEQDRDPARAIDDGLGGPPPAGAEANAVPLPSRLRGAERVVVGTVRQVEPAYGLNEYGDNLILSKITLEVHEPLRGDLDDFLSFDLEGGTVGEITLRVSDLPTLVPGDRGVFALRRSTTGGNWLPHGRSLGIMLTPADADLEPFRQAERASR